MTTQDDDRAEVGAVSPVHPREARLTRLLDKYARRDDMSDRLRPRLPEPAVDLDLPGHSGHRAILRRINHKAVHRRTDDAGGLPPGVCPRNGVSAVRPETPSVGLGGEAA
jgi:hypothetical protein